MRASEDFETLAMDIYQLFDDVINNLETVDKALYEIRTAVSMSYPLNKPMLKVNVNFFPKAMNKIFGVRYFQLAKNVI